MIGEFGIVTIVQCRFGSSRLKGKALRPLAGRPMLDHVLERSIAIGFPVVLATSVNRQDNPVAKLGAKAGVGVFRGDEHDVLGRIAEAAREVHARVVIRVTGDCPLLAPDVARDVLRLYLCAGVGIASNDTANSGWPDGLDVEVFQAADLYAAEAASTDQADREHVTPFIKRSIAHIVLPPPIDKPPSKVKLSVDTESDYRRVGEIFSKIPKGELDWLSTLAALRLDNLSSPAGRAVRHSVQTSGDRTPPVFSAPVVAALRRQNLTPAAAAKLSDERLLALGGIGSATVEKLRNAYGAPEATR